MAGGVVVRDGADAGGIAVAGAVVSVEIVVPAVPDTVLRPNARGHWRDKAAAVKVLRRAAYLATVDALNTPGSGVDRFCGSMQPVTLDAVIEWPPRRKRHDDDGAKACLKAAIDGVADALFNGQDSHVTLGTVEQKWGSGVTVIRLREGV